MVTYPAPADLLAAGLDLPPVAEAAEPVPPGTVCALTGQPLTTGYPRRLMTTEATTEFLDHFRGDVHGWVSESAARCYRSANPRAGNPCARSILAVQEGAGAVRLWSPLIARESAAAQGRPCWSALVRLAWQAHAGRPVLAILTTNTKKRLWPRARVGALGSRTPLYYYDSDTQGDGVLWLDWPRLLACLDLVEELYTAGFPKPVLRTCLLRKTDADPLRALAGERALAPWRGTPEFRVAALIAQKTGDPDADA